MNYHCKRIGIVAALVVAVAACSLRAAGLDVSKSLKSLIEADWIRADRDFNSSGKQSPVTTAEDAAGGCDGVKNGKWGFHVASGEQDPWWQVDLGRTCRLDRVVIYNRTDSGTARRTANIQVLVATTADNPKFHCVYANNGKTFYGVNEHKPLVVNLKDADVEARIVRLQIPGKCSFALDEVEVYAVDDPAKNIALGRPADQKSTSQYSYRSPTTIGEGDFSIAHIRDVIARSEQLADRLKAQGADSSKLRPLLVDLASLKGAIRRDKPDATRRKAMYMHACELNRTIALSNRLLNFDKILFIKRHDAKGVFHMCDQYYGFNGVRGGGLYVLSDPFGDDPKLTDLTAGVTVENGRLKGESLTGGVFLSPELSYDGRTVLFAWCEGTGKDLEWTKTSCYHIFRINSDGTGLRQLTDGPWDDFDPCLLPDGRIVFISERRGGYLRCGRHCPVYTMFSMAPDGSNITCMSYHETHEWQPSVDNDGMIVYTRWDYVDRDTNIAHHIWTCFPDGRNPRSFHGNYPVKRESRPWMEMSIRAIPNSYKYVATAAAHHGHAFGSLVMIDRRIDDDHAMSQLTRLTPEVPFPEAEKNIRPIAQCMVYATPWPLSEDDYLCAYGVDAKDHGIYLIDRFGNHQLIYRDPSIACQSPIPLRARPVPPVIPSPGAPSKFASDAPTETIAVMNVYNSDFDWPAGSVVKALRIIQLLPKTTAPPNDPRIGVADQTNARAVLGTVPVEPDGSAYFQAPVGKAIYFQALDDKGMAIQSMRSVTYVHPGEQMTCAGCHEPKRQIAKTIASTPAALHRAPSKIKPEVDGASPFSYVRLVQPVLDRNCVSCHKQMKALDLGGEIEGPHHWTRSYNNLAAKYGFYFDVSNGSINNGVHGGSRTIPGHFGAKASKLLDYTTADHYDVHISDEDRHRLILWLDCNSEFFGSYENTLAQAKGEIVYPTLN